MIPGLEGINEPGVIAVVVAGLLFGLAVLWFVNGQQ